MIQLKYQKFFAILVVATAVCSPATRAQRNHENLEILKNIDKSIHLSADPCDDFYQYSCGDYSDHRTSEEYGNSTFMAVMQFENEMDDVFRSKYPYPSLPKSGQNFAEKAAIYYHSCMNVQNKWNMFRYLDEIKPGDYLEWPLLEEMNAVRANDYSYDARSWPSNHFNALELMGQLYSYGVRDLLIDRDFSRFGIFLKAVNMTSLRGSAVDKLLSEFGLPQHKADKYRDEILEYQEHWQYVYKAYAGEANIENISTQYYALMQFLDKAFPRATDRRHSISTDQMDYFRDLLDNQWTPDEERIFCNFLMVKLLQYVKKNFYNKCITNVRTKFGLALNYMYYEHRYLPVAGQLNDEISHIIKTIHKYYAQILKENRMSLTKDQWQYAVMVTTNTRVNVGNLPENVTFTQVEKYYSFLPDLDMGNFYKNDLLLLAQRESEPQLCDSKQIMFCDNAIIQPTYNNGLRLMVIPFASLKMPMYDSNLDPLFIFSTLGFQLGHAYTNSIDPTRLEMDSVQVNIHYDNITDNPIYKQSINCLKQQHTIYDMNLNLADLMGAQVAYRAYTHQYKEIPDFTTIPGPTLFFGNLAQSFCTTADDNYMPHDVQRSRLHGVVKNMDEFAQAYQCPQGSRMNPRKKCHFY